MRKDKYYFMREGHHYFDKKRWMKFNQLIAINISLDSAIFFGYLYNMESLNFRFKIKELKNNDYWFTFKREDVLRKINMCFSRQRKCIEELENLKLIETNLRQNKLKWYSINWEEFIKQRNNWDEKYILEEQKRVEKFNQINDENYDEF